MSARSGAFGSQHPAADEAFGRGAGSGPPTRPPALPTLPRDAHKGLAGRLLCLCGSAEMPGAAVLAVRAAARAGAGLVTLGCSAERMLTLVPIAAPEAVLADLTDWPALRAGGLGAWLGAREDHARVVGPGLGRGPFAAELVRAALEDGFEGATVLDADGLNALGTALERVRAARGAFVLTPHPGEASRLLGRRVGGEPRAREEAVLELAEASGAVVVLKGAGTLVAASGSGPLHREEAGNPGLASAGTGDVLAGVLGAYLAQTRSLAPEGAAELPGFGAFEAAVAAVSVHARAGDLAAGRLGERALIASDLVRFLPRAQREREPPRAPR